MSTKIYNFYRYEGGDIFQLHQWLQDLRRRYIDLTVSFLKEIKVDRHKLTVIVEEATKEGLRGAFNIEASVCVFFHEGQLYVQFFGVPNKLIDQASLVDCHYQNQTDQPEEVSDEEWEERGQLTDAIFIDSRPSRDGLVFILADEYDVYTLCYAAKHPGS